MSFKKLCISFFFFLFISTKVYADIENEYSINSDEIKQEILQTSSNSVDIPDINSKSAVVIDRASKKILYEKEENEKRKMASTTKIMTAIIVLENTNLYDTVTVSNNAANTGGSRLGLKSGDKITVCDLMYGLLLRSGNDAAVCLAEYISGDIESFSILMNNKAKELGLANTHFVTPHGLDNDNHYTTAYELAILTDYALKNQTFLNFVSSQKYTVTINSLPHTITNTNELLGNLNGVYGVKTGFTNGANRCIVTACKRNNLDIICVVLGADTKKYRTQDSIKLIEYCFKTFEIVNLKQLSLDYFDNWKKDNIPTFEIKKSKSNNFNIDLSNYPNEVYPIEKQYINSILFSINCNKTFDAPLHANSKIGTLTIQISENEFLNYDIITTENILKKNFIEYYLDLLFNCKKYLYVGIDNIR